MESIFRNILQETKQCDVIRENILGNNELKLIIRHLT